MSKSKLLICLTLATLTLSGCVGGDTKCKDHVDENEDGVCDVCGEEVPMNFKNLEFKDKTFEYDGKPHSLEVTNAPSTATISYTNNNQTEVGVYDVTATVSDPRYNTKELSAKLTILNAFQNLKFENKTVNYDGKYHTIEVENLPDFATVTYSNTKGYSAVGTYTLYATVEAEGYFTKELSATLTINSNEFTGITFSDKTFTYDGYYHSIYVEGAPDFATVKYSNNEKKDRGTYVVTATISATGYKTLTLKANLIITKQLPKVDSLVDRTFFYTGDDQTIIFTYPDNLPSRTKASFKIDGVSVDSADDFKVKTLGTHTVSITLSNDDGDYDPCTTTATIKVVNENVGGVDSSKDAFKITKNIKYQELRSEILKGNFTVSMKGYDDYFYPNGDETTKLLSTQITYVANGEMFSYYDLADKVNNPYDLDESRYIHAIVTEDEVLEARYVNGLLSNSYDGCNKYPASAWAENFIGAYGTVVLAYLTEDTDGSIKPGSEGGYSTTYGSFSIDTDNNSFTLTKVNHYYHDEFNKDERFVYTIYNIGNTKIDILDELDTNNVDYDLFGANDYSINGIKYTYSVNSVTAYPIIEAEDIAFLGGGEFVVPAYVFGVPVKQFSNGYYDPFRDNDCSNFTYKVRFDSGGLYQGEYIDLGQVKTWREIEIIEDDGGTILYYGQW